MSRSLSDRLPSRRLVAGLALVAAAGFTTPLAGQQAARRADVVSSEIAVSREAAALRLELAGGRTLEMAIRDGGAFLDGTRVGDAARGGTLDRAWRELLNEGMDVPSAELPELLAGWSGPGDVGARMAATLAAALAPATADSTDPDALVAPAVSSTDSLDRLLERISELERRAVEAESRAAVRPTPPRRPERPARPSSPFRHISQGLAGVFSLVVTYFVLFAIGVGVIFFGGRRYIEGVADTARRATTRSLLVGVAAAFLIVPAFILGIIALVVSIVGIPGLLVWVPGFPLAVVLAGLLGYLGVAHAAGEALAERRLYAGEWFRRGNSYYFLLTGLGLLLAFYLAGNVVHMAGPWLRVIRGMLMFLGFVTTFLAVAIGFGATLLSRGGSRPVGSDGRFVEPDLFDEEEEAASV
jgi:MFS family permease